MASVCAFKFPILKKAITKFRKSERIVRPVLPRPGGDVWRELLQPVKMRKKKGTVNVVRSVCDVMHSLLDAHQEECYTTKKGDTWTVICNQLGIGHSDRRKTYKWLIGQYSYDSKFQIPNPYEMANGTFTVGPGVPFPRPHGDKYDSLRLEERDNSAQCYTN
jgi:hypothetical protein